MSRERSTKAIDYIQDLFVQESDLHKQIAGQLEADGKLGINVSSFEGALLQFIVQISKAQTVLEIGTLYGYSTLWLAEAVPANGRVVSIEKDNENFKNASELLSNSEYKNKIELLLGEADEVLKHIDFTPDVVFIDADKGGYAEYLIWAMENVAPGGLIIGDNTFLFGHMYGEPWKEKVSEKALRSVKYFNDTLANRPDFASIMIPTVEGLTVAQKRI